MNNKYDFNAYDTIIALVLTQFLKERNYKAELRNVVETGTVDGAALADLLNRAVAWSKGSLNASSNRYTEEMKQAAADLQFEKAAEIRDQIKELRIADI